ncbi:MAG TPA: hypothetical protein VHL98_03405 [Microvirga sp.]|jgi:hypothetical protein|nr:hypothetical protein [Microvirga sp.]
MARSFGIMRIPFWLGLAIPLGLLPAAAQEVRTWRDPDQGCTYILTPQGGVGLRYRADGTPDCPDVADLPVAGRPVARAAPAGDTRRAGSRPPAPPAAAPSTEAQRRALTVEPETTGSIAGGADLPRRAMLAFTCRPTERSAGAPATVRVQVQPESRVMLVDAGSTLQRYTLDTDWDVWFNGRSERDPRLGIILSPSRGSMWLDVPSRASPRQEVRSLPFACESEGSVY